MLSAYFKVCLYSGLVLAMPFIVYQLFMLIRPVLSPILRRQVFIVALVSPVLLLIGVLYTYYVFIPPAFSILLNDWGISVTPKLDITSYISFVFWSFFWHCVIFEMPIVVYFLAKSGLVTHSLLLKRWRWFLVGSVLIAAVLTPTGNPFQQKLSDILLMDTGFVVSGPILLLYFSSILVAWLARRQGKQVPAVAQTGSLR